MMYAQTRNRNANRPSAACRDVRDSDFAAGGVRAHACANRHAYARRHTSACAKRHAYAGRYDRACLHAHDSRYDRACRYDHAYAYHVRDRAAHAHTKARTCINIRARAAYTHA